MEIKEHFVVVYEVGRHVVSLRYNRVIEMFFKDVQSLAKMFMVFLYSGEMCRRAFDLWYNYGKASQVFQRVQSGMYMYFKFEY